MLYIFLEELRHPVSMLPLIRKYLSVTLISSSFSVNLCISCAYCSFKVVRKLVQEEGQSFSIKHSNSRCNYIELRITQSTMYQCPVDMIGIGDSKIMTNVTYFTTSIMYLGTDIFIHTHNSVLTCIHVHEYIPSPIVLKTQINTS